MKKRIRFLFFACLVLFSFSTKASAQVSEEISSFHSNITVNQDTSLTIEEEINYTTTLQKHGIYRYIPVSYNKDGSKEVLMVSNVSVTDGVGKKIQYTRSLDGNFVTLKIGDPDLTFTGEQTYHITYDVERALNQFEDHSELYWDITGEGWKVPILSSTATVTSKYAAVEKVACFTGLVGSSDGLCESSFENSNASFSYDSEINYGSNFTVVVSFPKETQLHFPSQTELFLLWLKYNWVVLLVPLPLLVMFVWWYQKGRDIQFISANVFDLDPDQPTKMRPFQLKAREPFVYEPLQDLSPGEAGALLDEKVDTEDIVAEILELARKKYLKLDLIETKKFFQTKRDYQFSKLKKTSTGLSEVQAYLFEELFKLGEVTTVAMLKGSFYRVMEKAKTKLEASLVKKKVFSEKPTMTRGKGITAFVLMDVIVVAITIGVFIPLGIFWPIPILMLQLPFGILLAYNLPQKTAVGTNLWLQARGLKKTIAYGKWREEVKEKRLFIEEVLPFAVALGVVGKLSKDMKKLNIQPPDYLHTANLTTWNTAQFLSGFSQEVGTSLSYNPSSSSSSGGSGFGGGSSGGGGGGGGGGSW